MYVLITPARNEEQCIRKTLESVVSQSVLPREWIIVNDGSIDRTGDIVDTFAKEYPFIKHVSVERLGKRNFAAKSLAIKMGCERVQDNSYEFIGNLDADVSFETDYFENILMRFQLYPRLGIAGGLIQEFVKGHFVAQRISMDSVAGAVQMFRRQCFDDVGGYLPLRSGAIDAVAEIVARARGWDVMTLPQLKVNHHRPVGSGMGNVIALLFKRGVTFYQIGYHPLFQIARSLYRFTERPYAAGGIALLAGYCWAGLMRYGVVVPDDVRKFLRQEQMQKLKSMMLSLIRHG